ncbi:hypothetical protein [Persicobacter psychrovividus]|uniref:DUF4148 domain-containing protein n=1 Tax=Persicobacter psychrovividus TaxID=387638 RepID=A0ABM7VL15_9BACT|nr:hypothetical protein PEPS_39330 [Persicobacter psychrovividus]
MKKVLILVGALLVFGVNAEAQVKSNKNAVAKARMEKLNGNATVQDFEAYSQSDKAGRARQVELVRVQEIDEQTETHTVQQVRSDKSSRKLVK